MNDLSYFNRQLIDGLKFCSEVYRLFEKRRVDNVKPLRLSKSNIDKLLLEELLPICRYVQKYYKAGRYISVCWINGNQSYDAKICQKGYYIDYGYHPSEAYLEITSAMHKNEHWTWKLDGAFAPEGISKKNGEFVSAPYVFTNQEHVKNFAPIVIKQITKKTNIPYPENTSLVVQCYLNNLYLKDEWELLVKLVKNKLPEHSFREIFIYDSLTGREAILSD